MPLFVSHNIARTSEEADAKPFRRRSTTISMMEEEFGICPPPRAVGRFAIPLKLWILPPKRRRSTQAPEPRRSTFLTGSWETMWDCDAEGSYLVESPPDEDADGPLDGAQGGGVQGQELNQEATTPIFGASWSTDGEATPLFSSHFPQQPDHRDLWVEGELLEEPMAVGDAPADSRLNSV